jgi:hypothetical protein
MRPIGRPGYYDYTCIESIFEMLIAGPNDDVRFGMEGRRKEAGESEYLPQRIEQIIQDV